MKLSNSNYLSNKLGVIINKIPFVNFSISLKNILNGILIKGSPLKFSFALNIAEAINISTKIIPGIFTIQFVLGFFKGHCQNIIKFRYHKKLFPVPGDGELQLMRSIVKA